MAVPDVTCVHRLILREAQRAFMLGLLKRVLRGVGKAGLKSVLVSCEIFVMMPS